MIYCFHLFQLVTADTGRATDNYDKQRRILLCKGPFISVRLAQRSFGGGSRPSSTVTVSIMENLEKDGFGKVITVERSNVLFKKLPSSLTDEELDKYDLSREQYRESFVQRADKALISREQFNKFIQASPDKDDLSTLHSITCEEEER